jgi:hypothetical protein
MAPDSGPRFDTKQLSDSRQGTAKHSDPKGSEVWLGAVIVFVICQLPTYDKVRPGTAMNNITLSRHVAPCYSLSWNKLLHLGVLCGGISGVV